MEEVTTPLGISKVTVIFLLNSSSPGESSKTTHDSTSQYIVSSFIILLFLISFTCNLLLLITLSSSYSLRRVVFNWLLLNLSVVCLTECVFNVLIAIYYVAVYSWKLGKTICSLNAFSTQLVTLQITLSVCTLCLERLIASWRPEQFKRLLTVGKQTVAIVILWLAACLLCVPVLAQTIESRLYPDRYGCSIADNNGDTYAILMTVWCYALPLVLILCYVCHVGCSICKNKRASRNKKQEINYTDMFFQESYLWSEWSNHTLLMVIVGLYVFLQLPYIVVQQISAICSCYQLSKSVNSTSPNVERTSKLDTTFTWFRYLFSCLYPITVFWFRKDVRKKFLIVFGCCRSNAVDDFSPRPTRPSKRKKRRNKGVEATKENNEIVNITTPVLFATDEGLHLRVLDLGACLNLNPKSDVTPPFCPRYVSYFCDVDEGAAEKSETILCVDDEMDSGVSGCSTESTVTAIGDLYVGGRTPVFPPQQEEIEEEQEEVEDNPKSEEIELKTPSPRPPPKPKKCVRFSDTVTIFRPWTARLSLPDRMEASRSSEPTVKSQRAWVRTGSESRQEKSKIPVLQLNSFRNSKAMDINPTRIKAVPRNNEKSRLPKR